MSGCVRVSARISELAVAERAGVAPPPLRGGRPLGVAGSARRKAHEHWATSARPVQGFSPSRSTRDWVIFISQYVTSPFLCERPADEPSSYFSS